MSLFENYKTSSASIIQQPVVKSGEEKIFCKFTFQITPEQISLLCLYTRYFKGHKTIVKHKRQHFKYSD